MERSRKSYTFKHKVWKFFFEEVPWQAKRFSKLVKENFGDFIASVSIFAFMYLILILVSLFH